MKELNEMKWMDPHEGESSAMLIGNNRRYVFSRQALAAMAAESARWRESSLLSAELCGSAARDEVESVRRLNELGAGVNDWCVNGNAALHESVSNNCLRGMD